MVSLNTWTPGVTGEFNSPNFKWLERKPEKHDSEWNEKTQVNVLKSAEQYLGNEGEEERWRCSGYCQHRVLDTIIQHTTWQSFACVFSGNFCYTNIWVCAVQRRSNARKNSYLLAKPRISASSPPPQKSQTTSKSQLQNCLTKATFLWINIKNRPQELDLKKQS